MAKKPTMREMEERVSMITRQMNFNSRMMESLGIAFSEFVKFSGKEEDFKNHLENNKNLHKLTKDENESREKGNIVSDNDVSAEEIRKKSNGKK